jgi:hypothetical protein
MTESMGYGGMGMMDSAQGWAGIGLSALLWLDLLVLAVLVIVWLVAEIGGSSGPAQGTDDAPE